MLCVVRNDRKSKQKYKIKTGKRKNFMSYLCLKRSNKENVLTVSHLDWILFRVEISIVIKKM